MNELRCTKCAGQIVNQMTSWTDADGLHTICHTCMPIPPMTVTIHHGECLAVFGVETQFFTDNFAEPIKEPTLQERLAAFKVMKQAIKKAQGPASNGSSAGGSQ